MKAGLSGYTIKIIAAILMVVDHVAFAFVPINTPLYYALRAFLGRISLPLFLFLLVEGFKYTRNKKKHLFLLFFVGSITEVLFDLTINKQPLYFEKQNVMLTLSLAFAVLMLCDKINSYSLNINVKYALIAATTALASMLAYYAKLEYSWAIIIATVFAFLFYEDRFVSILGICIILMCYSVVELSALVSIPIIILYNGKEGRKNKIFFYSFYPLHLLLIYLVTLIV